MLRPKMDPYSAFKSDTERRRALATLVRWRSASVIAIAMAMTATGSGLGLKALLTWLGPLLP